MQRVRGFFRTFFWLSMLAFIVGALVFGLTIMRLQQTLPDVEVLKEMQLQVPLRIYTQDNQLLAEYGEKRRLPVPLKDIPPDLVHAMLATEDSRFYQHTGVDFVGLMRAAMRLVVTGHAEQGGSTITMQVARNFFLTPKKTISRKLQEILLAIKIDKELSKEKILELYLNKIYFGQRSYGVGAAAQTYFGKALKDLTLPECALIAGLPKAPSSLNPLVNPEGALNRRNHVLKRMNDQGFIDNDTLLKAQQSPLNASFHSTPTNLKAPYVAEMVRQALVDHFGEEVYTQGLQVYTTIDSRLQDGANRSLKQGLEAYDTRHGFSGPLKRLGNYRESKHEKWLSKINQFPSIGEVRPAAILGIENNVGAKLLLGNNRQIYVPWANLYWNGNPITTINEGWIIDVMQTPNGAWKLTQIPKVEGALVALQPQSGAIMALVGGYDVQKSKFNRATQAERQPGSSFKPFVYAAALARGYTLATLINDAPIVVDSAGSPETWRPQNDQRNFLGPTRMRVGLVQSRNLVSIRLLDAIGIDYALGYLKNFGFDSDKLPNTLSLALGTGTVSPLQLASAYAVFANGGYKVTPYVIDHINDSQGKLIYKMDPVTVCPTCEQPAEGQTAKNHAAPRVITPQVAYLITSALQDVIQHGTGFSAKSLQRPDLAGKTGTTSDQKDGWFAGYNSDIVVTTWVGYDQPESIREYGATTALPIWMDFMRTALASRPPRSMPMPDGIMTMPIDARTGQRADEGGSGTISEYFDKNAPPSAHQTAITGSFTDPDTGIDHSWPVDGEDEPSPTLPNGSATANAAASTTNNLDVTANPNTTANTAASSASANSTAAALPPVVNASSKSVTAIPREKSADAKTLPPVDEPISEQVY